MENLNTVTRDKVKVPDLDHEDLTCTGVPSPPTKTSPYLRFIIIIASLAELTAGADLCAVAASSRSSGLEAPFPLHVRREWMLLRSWLWTTCTEDDMGLRGS